MNNIHRGHQIKLNDIGFKLKKVAQIIILSYCVYTFIDLKNCHM